MNTPMYNDKGDEIFVHPSKVEEMKEKGWHTDKDAVSITEEEVENNGSNNGS